MPKTNLSKEDHPVIGELLISVLTRDIDSIKKIFPDIDEDFIERFKEANQAVKDSISDIDIREKLKKSTKELYEHSNKLKDKVALLKEYMERGGLNSKLTGNAGQSFRRKNIEGGVKALRDVKQYLLTNKDKMRMPENFLLELYLDVDSIEKENLAQNLLKSERKLTSAEANISYKKHFEFITKASRSGKFTFRGSPKKEEYVIYKLMQRVALNKKDKSPAKQPIASKE